MKNHSQQTPILNHNNLIISLLFLVFSNLFFAQTKTIPAGSVIINMGIVPQTYGNALKPYGLVFNFLTIQKVPVIWSINPTKIKDGVDFTVDGINFKGGPFIIEKQYAIVPSVQAAIATFVAQGVIIHTTLSEVTVPVYQEMNENPNWVMDTDNGSIAATYINNAGIPASAYRTSLPTTLNYCDDLFILPHADPTWATHGRLFQWNNSFANGGNQGWIWEACHSVSVSEGLSNPSNPSEKLNFLCNDPLPSLIIFNSHSSSSRLPFLYSNPQSPYMQFMGILDAATKNGSEKVYLPSRFGGWRPSTTVSVWDPNQSDVLNGDSPGKAAIIAFGHGFGDVNRGKVMYEAGHSHNINSQDGIAAQRAMLNFSFDSPQGKSPKIISINSVAAIVCGSNSIAFSITATSPTNSPLSYQWSSSCGGTFSNPTGTNTNFIISASAVEVNCIVSVVVTDACGRRSFKSYPITIEPNVPPIITATQTNVMCYQGATGSIDITVSGLAPYTYLWTGNGVNPTSEDQINLTAGTYTVKVTTKNGCSATSTFTITQPNNALSLTATQIPITCFGSQTGAINLVVSGGNPTYTYTWNGNGVVIPLKDQVNIGAGDYSVLVTDINGCQQSLSTSLSNGDGISPSVSVPLNESFQGCLSAISIPYSETETPISLATFNQLGGTFIDTSTISNITYQDTSTGNCPIIITRTFRVTDICGNRGSAIQTIRNIDTTNPTASNPTSIEISGCNGTFENPNISVVSDALDNCSTPNITFVNDSAPTISGCTETTIRTYKVTDACGNFINVTQNLIRTIDTTLPTASNPTSIEISGCNGTFENPNISVVSDALDNCSTPNITFVNESAPTISGCTETTIRTYKVTDACGNFITVNQNLIRTIDTTLPTASNPTDITIFGCNGTFENPNSAVVTDALDNCSTPNVTFVNDSEPTISGCTETTIRTYKVTDACGNFINVKQNLIRTIDTTLPTASNPNPIEISGCNGTFENPNSAVVTDASDNCSTPNITFVNDSAPTISGCTETTIRTYKVTDACGNFITVTQNLIRTIDTTNPTASNPTDISISGCNGTFENPNSAVVTDASDNCSTPNVTFVNDSAPTISGCTETTVRTYKVTDACGNFINLTQNLIRTIDTTNPTASNPNSIEISGCNGTFENPNSAAVTDASDNCSTPNITFVNDSAPTISGCTETTVRTYKVTDACGNFINVTQNLIRTIDTTNPAASNPTDITIIGCNGTFENPNSAVVTDASDNCSTPEITFVNDSEPTISGSTETTVRTYKVNDACGNFITVNQNLIRTIDTTNPTASNPNSIEISGCNGTFENPNNAVVTDASDNCSIPEITFVNDSAPTVSGCTETNIRTYKVTDACGNFINVTQNLIRTIDTTNPTASNPIDITISGCNGTFENPNSAVVTDASDNCSTPNVTFVNDSAPTISGCTETTARTYKVTDACGNFITVTQNLIRTIDTTNPTASNPTDITIIGCNGTFENPNNAVVTDALDNCSTPEITFVNDSAPTISGCTETTFRTYKVTDACGNFINVSQNLIRTIDTTLPTASNPNPIEISGCNGTFESPNSAVVTDASDNCSIPNVTFVNDSSPTVSGCTETTVRTYKVTDACGNFINVTQNLIRTIDTTLPTASNPTDISIFGCNGTFENPNSAVVTDASDNCSTPNVTFVNDSLPTVSGCTETTIRTYKVTDACGNFINVTQNLIRTIDTTNPTASNPNSIEIYGCNGTFASPNSAVVTDASDNCSTPNITFVNDSAPTVSGCTESTIRTYKVTDACGNFITVSQNLIRTIDTTNPTASNPNPIEISGCNGTFENPNITVVADASDNCSTPNVTFVNDSAPTISGCTETTIRTYKITDACGNFINVTQNLIRTIDTTNPTASNPNSIEIYGCNGTFASPNSAVVTDASDNCSTPNITFVNDSAPTVSGCTESTIRTYKVTDACGNFITVSQNLVRTIDTTNPTASNPNPIEISGCNGTFENPNISVVADASDNCSTPNVTFVNDSAPTVSGCTETTIRTYKVTDACGNFINVTQNLIRTIDTTLPTASNPTDISIFGCNRTFENPNSAVVTDALDNCSTPNVTFVNDSLPTVSGCTETTIRTYKVTDACGNFITVNQNLIRTIDTTLPTASNPNPIEITGCNGTFENPNSSVVTDASDNCSTPEVTFVNDSSPTISGCNETTIRTYKVTDVCGNFINVTQNLIRTIDTTNPTASNPNPIEITGCNGTFENPNSAVVTDASDNCSTPNITFVNDSSPTVSGCTETTIRTYKVNDACGNFINVSQNLIRTIDTTLPTASNPNPIEISGCNGTFENPNSSVVTDASDNCSMPEVTFVNDSSPTISGCNETTIRTYKVTDVCGNFINVTQNLIRTIDTTLPTASNPIDITISDCNGTFASPNSAVVTDASDNCSTPNITFVNDSSPTISGCTETTIRTYKVTDACGNFITVSQNLIRTIDTTNPTASNPTDISISGCNGTFENPNSAVVTDASDNCSTPNITFVNDSAPTVSGCTETTVRTYKIYDACGNFINVTQNLIRTFDTTLPTASNPADITISGCNGTFESPNSAVVTDSSDNCSTPNVTFVNDSAPTVSGCTETTIRTYKVTDACGNFITVTQNLIRTIDTTLPTASNPTDISIFGCNGTFESPNSAVVTDAWDNCSTPVITFVNDSTPTVSGCTETTIRTYKVTDACGNFITVSQNLIRTIDTTNPTASNPIDITISGCNGTFENPNITVVSDASDNCSTPNVTFVNDSTPTVSGCTETTIRTYKITDACGNFINVTQNLIRTIDTTLPTASNPTDISISGCNGTFASPNSAVVTDASDNCSTPNVTFVNDSLPTVSGCTETTIRTYKVTDACGNFINVTQNLIRTIDTTLPTASNPTDITISGCNGTFENPNNAVVIDASDNCSTPNITFVNDSAPTVSGCTETTVRTYKVTDACGNFINVTQNLIRTIDTTNPTASNPTDISISGCNGTFENPNSAVVTDASDNCSTPNITFVNDSAPTVSGCTETTIRTYKVSDACGNFINVTQNLIRTIDTTNPTASNPTDISISGCNGTFENPNITVVADASDNCSTPNVTFVNDSAPTISGCTETTVRTYKVTDTCGNFINVTQNLIRTIDTTNPTASNPNSIEISGCNGTFPSPNSAVVSDTSDNCSTPEITFVNDSAPTVSGCTETTIRTYKVNDACGNFINVTQNLIRTIDTTNPTFTTAIPANISVSCDEIPTVATITATDNCGNTTIEFTESRINENCTSNYILTRQWKATDSCGNFNIATQQITVSDTKAPTIIGTFESILNINCDQVPPIPTLQFTDNCSGVGTIIPPSADVLLNQTPSGYSIIREWNVADLCGNSHTFTQTINITIQNNLISLQEQACNGEIATINLNDLIPSADVGSGTWVDLNNGVALQNGIFTPLGVLLGNYIFEYQTNSIYCPRKIQISMTVNDDCVVLACGNIIVHNAFSPNNDGLNENFVIENLENRVCYPTNKVEIYNRWGILIYETENYDNDSNSFKGISEGRTTIKKSDELPTGTYFYLLKFTDDQGINHKKDGYLYLSR